MSLPRARNTAAVRDPHWTGAPGETAIAVSRGEPRRTDRQMTDAVTAQTDRYLTAHGDLEPLTVALITETVRMITADHITPTGSQSITLTREHLHAYAAAARDIIAANPGPEPVGHAPSDGPLLIDVSDPSITLARAVDSVAAHGTHLLVFDGGPVAYLTPWETASAAPPPSAAISRLIDMHGHHNPDAASLYRHADAILPELHHARTAALADADRHRAAADLWRHAHVGDVPGEIESALTDARMRARLYDTLIASAHEVMERQWHRVHVSTVDAGTRTEA